MITIDNAVELMVKTYLGLPKRITGLTIGRKRLLDITDSFPSMIDAIEEHASSRLKGIDLAEIEWSHTLRNQLYHHGNGLTVDKEKVEVYFELAKLLFQNLFDEQIEVKESESAEELGLFMSSWARVEQAIATLSGGTERNIYDFFTLQHAEPLVGKGTAKELYDFRVLRNRLVHTPRDYRTVLTPELLAKLITLTERVEDLAAKELQHAANPKVSLADLQIPPSVVTSLLDRRDQLSNWDILIVFLHFAPNGLTNSQIRALSEQLGKQISYSWFDTEFHRKTNEKLVISRPVTDSKEKLYFLSELGKRRALSLISEQQPADTAKTQHQHPN